LGDSNRKRRFDAALIQAGRVKEQNKKLYTRQAQGTDAKEIRDLSAKVYKNVPPYSTAHIRGQINNYPEGVFVAIFDDKVVGYCATVRVSGKKALRRHSWKQISGHGYGSTHEANGEWLYGYEVFVDPDYRRLRIGERLYRERRNLCMHYRLKGIIICGRLPFLSRRIKKVGSAEGYIKAAQAKEIRDPTFNFQMRQGFEFLKIVKNYDPTDKNSMGYGALMWWLNPEVDREADFDEDQNARGPGVVRVATVQYQQRGIHSFSEFEQIVTYFVDTMGDYDADFVVFPELFTLQLLSIENEEVPSDKAIDHLTDYTDRIRDLFQKLAIKYNINIIAGSHPTKMPEGDIHNICYVCLRDGSVYTQEKIHPTPDERYWWNIEGGDELDVIPTDCGPIGVLICYDCEFPELARHLTDQGANILFVPFCTAERQGYLRVRYSAQARAVENQCYVVLAGNVGNLPRVHNMDIQYSQSCILTPCDFYFARDGVAADTTPNVETVAIADLRMDALNQARNSGSVRNRADRRHDLYGVVWRGKSRPD
jgi:predicted amidohydrolase/GNAT superfamily N-acetyltransferase